MGKGVRGTKVVNEQLTVFVGRDKLLAHLEALYPVAPNLQCQLWLAQVVPGT